MLIAQNALFVAHGNDHEEPGSISRALSQCDSSGASFEKGFGSLRHQDGPPLLKPSPEHPTGADREVALAARQWPRFVASLEPPIPARDCHPRGHMDYAPVGYPRTQSVGDVRHFSLYSRLLSRNALASAKNCVVPPPGASRDIGTNAEQSDALPRGPKPCLALGQRTAPSVRYAVFEMKFRASSRLRNRGEHASAVLGRISR